MFNLCVIHVSITMVTRPVALKKDIMQYTASSIAADVRCHTSSIWFFLMAYFIDRKSVGYFGFGGKTGLEWTKYFIFPTFQGRALTSLPTEKSHCCGVSVTTTTPQPACHYPPSPLLPSINTFFRQWSHGVLQVTTSELLPTVCTLFPIEKAEYISRYLYIRIGIIHK